MNDGDEELCQAQKQFSDYKKGKKKKKKEDYLKSQSLLFKNIKKNFQMITITNKLTKQKVLQ